jgi:hypothetical protein
MIRSSWSAAASWMGRTISDANRMSYATTLAAVSFASTIRLPARAAAQAGPRRARTLAVILTLRPSRAERCGPTALR